MSDLTPPGSRGGDGGVGGLARGPRRDMPVHMKPPDLSHLAQTGARLTLRVTPGAGADRVALEEDGRLSIRVTAAPENGKANAAVLKLLAKALGVPKSRLTILRGQSGRDKVVEIG